MKKFISKELQNNKIRIILRTGQPGKAPEKENYRGLGLSVAKSVVSGHKGSVHVSKSPWQGTLIRVILPTQP